MLRVQQPKYANNTVTNCKIKEINTYIVQLKYKNGFQEKKRVTNSRNKTHSYKICFAERKNNIASKCE